MADKVKFIDTSKECKKTLEGLSKTALREGAKIIKKQIRSNLPVRTKRLKNHIASWARIDSKTGQPTLDIGFKGRGRVIKSGKKPSHASPYWIEFGTSPHVIKAKNVMTDKQGNYFGKEVKTPGTQATHILRNTVQEHAGEIREAQKEFLAYLNQTLGQAGAKVIDSEEVEDD